MRFLRSLTPAILLLAAGANAASSWGFSDATVSVSAKGMDAESQKLNEKSPLKKALELGSKESLKISLTVKENGRPKRPHQVFLVVKEAETGLEAPFPFTVKESGKAVVELSQKDLPVQHLLTTKGLQASIVIGSFGTSQGLNAVVFDVTPKLDPNAALPFYEKPLRYGKLAEIHHIFKPGPKNPPKIVSLVAAVLVLATLPALVIAWLTLGANVNHLQKAMSTAPASHAVFFGSIVTMELVFFLYYSTWNLFQLLPVVGIIGTVTFLSGSKALGEVQSRRLAGER